jgi:hypothetical protein
MAALRRCSAFLYRRGQAVPPKRSTLYLAMVVAAAFPYVAFGQCVGDLSINPGPPPSPPNVQPIPERIPYFLPGNSFLPGIQLSQNRLFSVPHDSEPVLTPLDVLGITAQNTLRNILNTLCQSIKGLTPALEMSSRAVTIPQTVIGSEGAAVVTLGNGTRLVAWVTANAVNTALLSANGTTLENINQYATGPTPENVIAASALAY